MLTIEFFSLGCIVGTVVGLPLGLAMHQDEEFFEYLKKEKQHLINRTNN